MPLRRAVPSLIAVYALGLLSVHNRSSGQDASVVPTYARTRPGADQWHARGGDYGFGRHGGYGGYGGFYQPYYAPPAIAGSWYERPYPYHFDYYQHRWGGAPTPTECDCATFEASPAPPYVQGAD